MGTRVLKAHIDSVVDALPAAKIALAVNKEIRSFAAVIAEAVITATDSKTQYVIITRTQAGRKQVVFGPYVTHNAALKALGKGLPLKVMPTDIVPLYRHPQKGDTFDE